MADLIEHLNFRARLQPTALAFCDVDRQMNFAQLAGLVRKTARKLRAVGVRPGQVVVTATSDKLLDWSLALALLHEATISCSNYGNASLDASFAYDWVITDTASGQYAPGRSILIDDAWLAEARQHSGEIEPIRYPLARSPARLFMTSGTTGHRKVVALDLDQIRGRSSSGILLRGANRTISLLLPSGASDFNASVDALVSGNPLYRANSYREAIDLIRRFSIETLHGAPNQLAGVIKELADTSETLDCLTMVRSVGASMPPALLKDIEERLTDNVLNLYGSTEAGNVCAFRPSSRTDPSIIGFAQLDVDIEIVDDAHAPVGSGVDGSIRIRTSHMAHEYWRNPEATAHAFRDGWFYPGDRGRLLENGLLLGAGRDVELLNLGGDKVDPVPFDLFMAGHPGVEDAAALGLENESGRVELVAALVVRANFDFRSLHRRMVNRFGKHRCPKKYFRVEQIPRNLMGKVMRTELGERLRGYAGARR